MKLIMVHVPHHHRDRVTRALLHEARVHGGAVADESPIERSTTEEGSAAR